MPDSQVESVSFVRAGITIAAAFGTLAFAMTPQVDAAWMAGRGNDPVSGVSYISVFTYAPGGERIEFNCTPSGQAFLATNWNANMDMSDQDRALTLRFDIDGSHRFAGPARLIPLEGGWAAAELDSSELLGPLTEALTIGSEAFTVEVVRAGVVVSQVRFDLDTTANKIARFRSYCRL